MNKKFCDICGSDMSKYLDSSNFRVHRNHCGGKSTILISMSTLQMSDSKFATPNNIDICPKCLVNLIQSHIDTIDKVKNK